MNNYSLRRRQPSWVRVGRCAVILAFCIGAAGCSSRVSHEALLSEQRGGPAVSQPGTDMAGGNTGHGAAVSSAAPAGGEGGLVDDSGRGTAPDGPAAVLGGGGSTVTAVGAQTPANAGRGAVPGGRENVAARATGSGVGATAGEGGSTAGDGGSSAAKPGTSSGTGCSSPKPPVALAAVGEQTGPAGVAYGDTPRAVAAWVASINAKGGLLCHPIKYIIADNGGDPARHQALTRKLVEEDKVVAFVGNNAAFAGFSAVKYLEEKRVPAIGSEGGSQWYYQSPMYFPQMSSGYGVPLTQFGTMSEVGSAEGLTKVATLSCLEAEACSSYYNYGPKWAEKFGMKLVYRGRASVVQPDFTSQCQAAQAAGAEMMIIGLDANSMARVAKSCVSVNYRPLFSLPWSGSDPKMASNPQLDGLVLSMPVLPWMITSNQNIVEFERVLKQYAPGLQLKAATITGWVAAKLFEAATQNLSGPPTSANILEGLWGLKDNDLGGLTYPLTFTRDKNAPEVLCYWQVQLKGGQWTSPNNGQRTCPPGWPSFISN